MPTGYTAPIYEGKDFTFEELVLNCARNFGALISMRDLPFGSPIPDEILPSDYYEKELLRIKKEYEDFLLHPKTDEEYEQLYNGYVERVNTEFQEREQRLASLRIRYNEMIQKAMKWQSPTPDHDNLKAFVISQLQDSLEADCCSYVPRISEKQEWIEYEKDGTRFTKEIEYYTENNNKEIESARSKTAWVKALKESLKKESEPSHENP